jgi:hypothetical protein
MNQFSNGYIPYTWNTYQPYDRSYPYDQSQYSNYGQYTSPYYNDAQGLSNDGSNGGNDYGNYFNLASKMYKYGKGSNWFGGSGAVGGSMPINGAEGGVDAFSLGSGAEIGGGTTGGGSAGSAGASGVSSWLPYVGAFMLVRDLIGEKGLNWAPGGWGTDVQNNIDSIRGGGGSRGTFRSSDDFIAGNLTGFGGGGLSKVTDVVSEKLRQFHESSEGKWIDPAGAFLQSIWK